MNTRTLWTWMLLLASFAFVLQASTKARAQDDEQGQNQDQGGNPDQDQDPPGRVARLNFAQGAISFRPAGEDDCSSNMRPRSACNPARFMFARAILRTK